MAELLQVVSSLLALALNVAFQTSLFRMRKASLLYSVFIGFFAGLLALIVFEILLLTTSDGGQTFIYGTIANFFAYVALGYCYFHFINLGETARRVRILWELNDSKNGLTASELLLLYDSREILDNRLHRLISNQQIIQNGDRLYVRRSIMLIITKILLFMRSILGIKH